MADNTSANSSGAATPRAVSPRPTPTAAVTVPDESLTDENTPFLSSGEPGSGRAQRVPLYERVIVYLTRASLILAALSVLLSGGSVVSEPLAHVELGWVLRDALPVIFWFGAIAVVFSSINISYSGRVFVFANLLGDLFIGGYVFVASMNGLAFINWELMFGPLVSLLLIITFAVGLLLALVHIALFVTRCIGILRSESWRTPWRFPSGEMSVNLSIKFLREPERDASEHLR